MSDTTAELSSAERLLAEALRFLRRFGLVAAVWATLLAVAVPDPGPARPAVLWAGIGLVWLWALASQVVARPRWWWAGWLLTAAGLELLGPSAGTNGWSLTGGASFIVLAGVAVSGRRRLVVATVAFLSLIALARGVIAPGWNVGGSLGTFLIFAFGGLALTWLARLLLGVLDERDALQARLLAIETASARQRERQESAARLHDTVLQHLTAVSHADGVDEARHQAGRASNELRQFLRLSSDTDGDLRPHLEHAVTAAADGVDVSIGVAGRRPMDDDVRLLVDAAAEAVRNARRHGRPPIRVFAESGTDGTKVWVTDRGDGFDPDIVPDHRLGVRESIVGRMHRAGGRAVVTTNEDGTEWELHLP